MEVMEVKVKTLLRTVCKTLHDGKATTVVSLATATQSCGLFAHLVIATAGSKRHAAALSARLSREIKNCCQQKPTIESSADSEWILLDAGDVVVHIFLAEARRRYDLESLWGFEKESP